MREVFNTFEQFILKLSAPTFMILILTLVGFAFYFYSRFMKANKKEDTKINKISNLLITLLFLAIIIVLTFIRK